MKKNSLKLLALLLALVLALGALAGCGDTSAPADEASASAPLEETPSAPETPD